MTKSTITRERLLEIIVTGPEASGAEQNELARMVLTAMDSEPVAWRWRWSDDTEGYWRYTEEQRETRGSVTAQPLYLHAQPAPERDQVRSAHAEWSQATFGNVGPVGPLKHLSKEALEAAAEPGDLSEWADMQFLMWDAQRRAGITDEQITQAMIEKLAVNKQREWPEPKDGEPRLHVKEQPAPEMKTVGYLFVSEQGAIAYSPTNWGMPGFRLIGQIYGDIYVESQPAPVVPAVSDDIGEIRVGRLPTMNQDDYPGLGDWWVQLRIGEDSDEVLARVYGATPQEANNRAEALACRAAMLSGGKS